MLTLITVIHVCAAVFIICVVLLQGGSSGGLGAGLGGGSWSGGNSQSLFGASGPTSFLGKLTYVFAIVFMVTSVGLTIMHGANYDIGLKEKLQKATDTPDDDRGRARGGESPSQ